MEEKVSKVPWQVWQLRHTCHELWLDDRRPAPSGWTRAYTVAEAQRYLATEEVEEASLDHDLGACEACLGGLSTRVA